MMAFATPTDRKRSRKEHFRCSECGREQFAVVIWDRPVMNLRSIVRACELHPDAPVLTWSGTEQGASIAIQQMLDGGQSWDAIDATIEAMRDSARRRALMVVAPLMRTWDGELPERRIDSPQPRSVVDPLFGGPAHPLSSRPKGVTP